MPDPEPLRVVVALEVSRDPVALALELARPGVSVVQLDPWELGPAIARRPPHLVIYSAPDEAVETRVVAWVLLLPGGENRAVVSLAGAAREVANPGLADVLAAVDAAAAFLMAAGRTS